MMQQYKQSRILCIGNMVRISKVAILRLTRQTSSSIISNPSFGFRLSGLKAQQVHNPGQAKRHSGLDTTIGLRPERAKV